MNEELLDELAPLQRFTVGGRTLTIGELTPQQLADHHELLATMRDPDAVVDLLFHGLAPFNPGLSKDFLDGLQDPDLVRLALLVHETAIRRHLVRNAIASGMSVEGIRQIIPPLLHQGDDL